MKLAIYDPYLHILGGAERYVLAIATCFPNADITVFANDGLLIQKAQTKFGLTLPTIIVEPWPINRSQRQQKLRNIDLFFYVTDGSIFSTNAKVNVLIIQTPEHIPVNNLINKWKLRSWQTIFCYSKFMAEIIIKRLGVTPHILFVPVIPMSKKNEPKEKMILSVGRFFPNLHSKKQLEMIDVFKELVNEGLAETQLCIVGSIDPGAQDFFQTAVKAAVGYPIKLITEASFVELTALYGRARVYWHAAGWGEDLVKHPERAEHFGVSTVEAMAQGAVPVVFAGGGQTEIVETSKNGYTWKTKEELKEYTQKLLSDDILCQSLAKIAEESAAKYTQDKFAAKVHEVLKI